MQLTTVITMLSAVICLATASTASGSEAETLIPEGYVHKWVVIGPFANPEAKRDAKNRGGFDIDYLTSLGGEAKAQLAPDTTVAGTSAKRIELAGDVLDFRALYADSDRKLAYAYTMIESGVDQEALFFLGSDDGAKVWVNGEQALEVFLPDGRGCSARQNQFRAKLHKGANSVLVKVENGMGDWKLVLECYGAERGAEIEAEIKSMQALREFQRQELALGQSWPGYVSWVGDATPRIIWRDADRVRELAGDIPLKVRWFDSKLNEVSGPTDPGRYAAYIEAKLPDGTPLKRAITFCRVPQDLNLWVDWGLDVPCLGKPFDKAVWKSYSASISRNAGRMYRDSLIATQDGAILLAALSEARGNAAAPTVTESPEVVNDEFLLALKLKLAGLTDKVRPLAPAKKRATPSKVLREGTPAEAGVKVDAKKKIDALCRKWAEDSGEPFTILIARHGVIVSHAAFGKTADGERIDLDYRQDVMSITKPITALLFSQFVDQGYVKLDDPIGKALPEFPTSGEHALTFRNLFTHTCSLEGHGEWGGIHNPYLDNIVLNGLGYIRPGKTHIYNGMGYDLAAKAMETMSGKSIVRLMHDHLFRPLGIQSAPFNDCAYGACLTSRDLASIAQLLANHGSYGDKQFISEGTFAKLQPEMLSKYYPGIDVEWGIGLTYFRDQKPGTPPGSKDPKDLILGEHVIGHGSASSCILRVDLDNDLVIAQIRRTAGPKYGEYYEKFMMEIAGALQ